MHPKANPAQTIILLNLDGAEAVKKGDLGKSLHDSKANYVTIDLRATGSHAWPGDVIGRAPDHNTAQWSMWIGRPLLGQWTYDVLRLIDVLKEDKETGIGNLILSCQGPAGVVGLCAAAVDPENRMKAVGITGMLSSYISDVPYVNQRAGVLAPGILRDVGDIPHLAALATRTQVIIVEGVTPSNQPLTNEELRTAFAVTSQLGKISGLDNLLLGVTTVNTKKQ